MVVNRIHCFIAQANIIISSVIIPLFLILLFSASASASEKKKILILHSYHQNYFWTDGIMRGILEVFDADGKDLEFYIENMDSKRFWDGLDGSHALQLKVFYQKKYANFAPDIIISSDDDALNFLVANRSALFTGVPIIFCGVNNFNENMTGGYKDITGVTEPLDIEETLDTALDLQPNTRTIALITDTATTGRANRRRLEKLSEKYGPKVDFFFLDPTGKGISYDALIAGVRKLTRDTVIYYSDFHIDSDGRPFDNQRALAREINRVSGLPVYTTYASVFGPGTVGGKINDPVSQGRNAALIALRILDGQPITAIPVQKNIPNRFMFQYGQLNHFGLLGKKLPAESVILGQPSNILRDHWGIVVGIIGLLLLQAAVIIFLIEKIHQNNRKARELRRWDHIFQNAQWGIAIGDPKTETITNMNPAFAQMHGYAVDELVNLPVNTVYSPEKRRELVQHIGLAHKNGHHTFESLHLRKDGSTFPVRMDVTAVRDGGGQLVYRVVNVQDISEQKQTELRLQRSEELFSLFMKHAPTPIAMFDREMRYIAVSQSFREGYNLKEQNLVGRSHYEIFPEMSDDWKKVHLRCLAGATEKREEDPFPRTDGQLDWVRWEICPWYETGGEVGGVILFSEVITERKKAQKELSRHRYHLEELIKERTDELEDKIAEIERLNRIFVDRELRMVELKNKIAELEKDRG